MDLRKLIYYRETSNNKRDCEIMALMKFNEDIQKLNIKCNMKYVQDNYEIENFIITPLIKYCDEWTNKFKDSFQKEKYYVTKNNQFHDNGNIIISNQKPLGSVIKHAFTIHSIQGQTCKTQLFIDMRNMFGGLQMLYTALSRAEYLENVHLIY